MSTQDLAAEVAERFSRNVANHTMTVLHDDGLYRQLRFQQPDRSGYWFDIVTWPGSLAVRGDMGGGYVFSRQTDMLEFFRRNGHSHGINPDYWAEKLPGGRHSVRAYSEEVLRDVLAEHLAGYDKVYPELRADYDEARTTYGALPREQRYPFARSGMRQPIRPTPPAEIRDLVANAHTDGQTTHEDGARTLLRDLEATGVVSDTCEWSLADWTWEFLWFCHAIQWGIRRYDTATAAQIAGAVTG